MARETGNCPWCLQSYAERCSHLVFAHVRESRIVFARDAAKPALKPSGEYVDWRHAAWRLSDLEFTCRLMNAAARSRGGPLTLCSGVAHQIDFFSDPDLPSGTAELDRLRTSIDDGRRNPHEITSYYVPDGGLVIFAENPDAFLRALCTRPLFGSPPSKVI